MQWFRKTLKMTSAAAGVCALAAVSIAWAQAPPPVHSGVDLISEESAVHAGQQVTLGLYFKIDPGWHTYWINPGDSGQAAFIRWQLPPGWRPGAIEWPMPERIQDHTLVDYGYQNELLLIVPTRVPGNLRAGQTANLRASVEWLVCQNVCIPAQATVDLPMPGIAGKGTAWSRWRDLFQKTQVNLPRPLPRGWSAQAASQSGHFILQIDAGHPLKAEGFFPLDPNEVDNAVAPVITSYARGARVVLAQTDQLAGQVARFRGVLVEAPERAYTVDAPVDNASAQPKRSGQAH